VIVGKVATDTSSPTSPSQVQRAAIEGTTATRSGVRPRAAVRLAEPGNLNTEADAVAHPRSRGIRR